jgi:hypothetical protein
MLPDSVFQYMFSGVNEQDNALSRDVWINCTPAQKILWNYLMDRFHPLTITPNYYLGPTGGCKYYTYDANHIYLALELGMLNQCSSLLSPEMDLYDADNIVVMANLGGAFPYWDTTAAQMKSLTRVYTIENVFFSRVAGASYTYMKFSGYDLLLP